MNKRFAVLSVFYNRWLKQKDRAKNLTQAPDAYYTINAALAQFYKPEVKNIRYYCIDSK